MTIIPDTRACTLHLISMFFIIILFMNTGEILLSFDVKQSINQ